MILQSTIDSVLNIPIEDVIGKYVQLKRAGANYKGLSPFSDERTPSFMVSPAKQLWKDFSTGKGGNNSISFIKEVHFYKFPEAVKHICSMFSIEYLETEMTNEEQILAAEREGLFIINQEGQKYFQANLHYLPEAMSYAVNTRMLTIESINKFGIGFAPNTLTGFTNHILNNGFNWTLAVKSSLLGHQQEKNQIYDRFRNRLMFPIRSITGNILGFGGRALEKSEKIAKYLNSSDSAVYNKSEIIYGIFESKQAIVKKNQALLAEGYMDVVMFHQKGVENIVASAGTALTIEQIKLIKRFTKNIVVIFDGDSAGIRASLRGIDLLLEQDMNVKVLVLPDGQDPDDFARDKTKEDIELYISQKAKDFVMFKLNHLLEVAQDDLSLRSDAVVQVIGSIAKIANPVAKEVYLRECSRIMDMNIESLRQMLREILKQDVDFIEAAVQSFEEQSIAGRHFLQEQCERKILQYVLAYGHFELNFKEVVLDEWEFDNKPELAEEVVINKRTVLQKVIHELEGDDIQFSNPMHQNIFDKAKTIDLSAFYQLQALLDTESFFFAEQLRNEELAMKQNIFASNEIVIEELNIALEKSINETLLFYKTIFIENMIQEESRKETIDIDFIKELTILLVKIKQGLNFI